MRPGNLKSLYSPTGFGSYHNLASFGKGAAAMPPGPPPGPGEWMGSSWKCPGVKPADDATGFYECCPDGWKKVPFGQTVSCGDSQALFECGPLPEGAAPGDFECVRGNYMPAGTPGTPSTPIRPEMMLAPDLELPQPAMGMNPSLVPVIGGGVALLFVVTIAYKMLS